MFTGIVEETGTILSMRSGHLSSELTIAAKRILSDVKIGDSICVNGVCLTVTRFTKTSFTADVMGETLRRSNLGQLTVKSPVNLERALSLSSRLGGHIVSGHIDGTGGIASIQKEATAHWLTIQASPDLLRYIVEKGSIAIDGVSLTVAAVNQLNFQVSIIPHTSTHTTLLQKKVGDCVNLECDIIGKYVEKLLTPEPERTAQRQKTNQADPNALNASFLMQHGYL